MGPILLGFAENLALMLAMVFCYGLIIRVLKQRALLTDLGMGLLFGCACALAMQMTVPISDDVIIDNRIAVIALAGLFTRWPAVCLACVIACFSRWLIGGLGTWPGIACIICAAVTGLLMSIRWSVSKANCTWRQFLALGIISVLVTLPWTFALPAPIDAMAIFQRFAIPVLVMYPLGALVLGSLLLLMYRSLLLIDELSDSEKRFRRLFEGAPDAILVADMETGVIVDVNAHACALLGKPREALIGLHQTELHPQDQHELHQRQFQEHVQQLLEDGVTKEMRSHFLAHDGSLIPVSVTASLYRLHERSFVVGFFTDLRKPLATERALANAEKLTQYLLENAEAIIVALNKAGEIILFNAFAEQLTGYTLSELQGKNWFETLCPRDAYPEVWEEFQRLNSTGIARYFINPIRTKDGKECIISWRNTVIDDEVSDFSVISIGIDITEQRHMEQELRQSEKLQALGQLAGGIAHDFNNQLQIINGFAHVLLDQAADADKKKYAQTIVDTCRRSADLTAQLLAFSRKETSRKEVLSVRQLLQDMREILERTLEKQITIEFADIDEQFTVLGSQSDLEHALINVSINARDAMPEGGTLSFEVHVCELAQDEGPKQLEAGTYICIQIRDTGCGMTDEEQRHIFEPFYSTKAQGQGTGLGLAAVYGTLQRHGGAVSVESTPNYGTCFTLWLPKSTEAVITKQVKPKTFQSLADVRLMMVDDEALIVEVIQEGLALRDVQVTTFTDARTASEYARQHLDEFNIALVDLNMPDMNGAELIKSFHQQRSDFPVIVGTGFGPSAVDAYLHEHAYVRIMSKPYTLDTLIAEIEKLLN